jgi:hypothetical protein
VKFGEAKRRFLVYVYVSMYALGILIRLIETTILILAPVLRDYGCLKITRLSRYTEREQRV